MTGGDQRTRAPVLLVIALLLIGLRGCTAHAQPTPTSQPRSESAGDAQAYPYMVPPELDDGWQTASLESVGIDIARIEQMTNAIRHYVDWNIHAVLIERDERLVYEEYFAGEDQRWGRRPLGRVQFDRQTKHDIRSVTKSVISALVGIAVAGGAIPSIDKPIVDLFPEHADLATPQWRRVKVRHALTMSAGLAWEELGLPYTDPRNGETRMTTSDDPIRYVLGRPVVAEPGATWNYNGGLTHLLGAIVQRSTGQPLETIRADGALPTARDRGRGLGRGPQGDALGGLRPAPAGARSGEIRLSIRS
jgi:CubicO group peptidase (beta-lactamase class C family)